MNLSIEIFQQGSANYDFALPAMALGFALVLLSADLSWRRVADICVAACPSFSHKHFGIWKDGTVLDTFV